MPAPHHNRWAETWEALKESASASRHGLRRWCDEARVEPTLIWQTPAVRYVAYALGGLVTFLALSSAIGMLQLPVPEHVQPRAKTAHFQVICSNPACGKYFLIERKFRFSKFPVSCAYCRELAGHRALRCSSDKCLGAMAIVVEEDGKTYCSQCGEEIGND